MNTAYIKHDFYNQVKCHVMIPFGGLLYMRFAVIVYANKNNAVLRLLICTENEIRFQ
ncbi:hypothetical protein P8H26_03305 [Pseudochrobactrum sp. sp1633]|uniref:hypothetical protein n=1 Tax=Pseudochrobactrum sp. sp1633 TaxID=3036706 RepID=UPI0025A532B6|nr:hypothetical protein [Pseudochrobactrum sp. sp1633]MDM8344415.1 hypothetical protein [Pseudochrobactrum sp. sp1633]HWD14453.1 hypothetical protein [Pseudochrobactrum sp.]